MMTAADHPPVLSPSASPSLYLQRAAQSEQASAIRHAVTRFIRELGCTDDQTDAVTLAVGEALNNAVCHGHETAGAEISVCCRLLPPGDLAIEVRNAGSGFLPDLATVSALPDGLDVHGRGFALMTMLMDDVQVFAEDDETVVRLVKRIAA